MSRSFFAKLHRRYGTRLSGAERYDRAHAKQTEFMSRLGLATVPSDCARDLPNGVAIVGGGFAGIATAWTLGQAGVASTVFEARETYGGRVESDRSLIPGRIIESGAELIGLNHPMWLTLARRFGLGLAVLTGEDQYAGAGLELPLRLGGKAVTNPKTLHKQMAFIFRRISNDAKAITDPFKPWTVRGAATWDAKSVAQKIAEFVRLLPTAIRHPMLVDAIELELGNDHVLPTKEQSYLGLLAVVSGGRLGTDDVHLDGYWTHREDFRCAEGNAALAGMMLEFGRHILLRTNSPVKRIEISETDSLVKVTWLDSTRSLKSKSFDYVVLTAPPSVWKKITITPALPPGQEMGLGPAVKHISQVDGRFWIKPGLAPSGLSDEFGQTWETTENQVLASRGVALTIFAGGTFVPKSDAEKHFMTEILKLYPGYKGKTIRYADWPNIEWIETGYACPKVGQVTTIAKFLSAPHKKRLYFAGEHTCMAYFGYMEGALQSGLRAAEAILATCLKKSSVGVGRGQIAHQIRESVDEGVAMNPAAHNRFLDEAERALQSTHRERRQSETSFLPRLLRDLGSRVSATGLSPAELFRSVLYNRPLMHNVRDVLQVVAMPLQQPENALRPGDWMLRAVPGTGDVGHVSVLASDDLLTASALASQSIATESVQPGQYGLVIEAGAFPHSRSRPFARRLLDSRGHVPPYTVLLRPKYPQAGALADFPPDEPELNDESTTQALSVLVVDERGQALVEGEYAVHQGERSEHGEFTKGGNGLASFKTIDTAQAFTFEVRDRVCGIGAGAFIEPDDPAIEYGGTWFDWTLVRDNKSPETAFWPHYLDEMKADGSRKSVDRFWQHEHIVRRPIRAIGAAGSGSKPVKICAVPTQIRTGPIVRYTDYQRASVWLEPATPSLVKLRVKRAGGREAEKTAYASTVRVGGRHFAIVEVDGLDPDTFYLYTLELAPLPAKVAIPVDAKDFDGVFPEITTDVRRAVQQQLREASVEQIEWLSFRTLRPRYDKSLRFATGSCRWYPGDVIGGDEKKPGRDWGPDMLDKLGEWLRKTPRPQWPHFQFYGGDQIYADEIGDGHHAELIRARFASRVPGPKDPTAAVATRLIDGAWAGRFAHRLEPFKAPLPKVRNNVETGLKMLESIYAAAPVLKLFANGRVTEKQLLEQYQTLLTRRRDVQGASREAEDERKARVAVELLPKLKALLVTAEPFRVYKPYWAAALSSGARNPQAYRYRSCNFLLWKLPNAEADIPTLQDQTTGDVGVRDSEGRGHASADGGRHVADFAEYAFLYERAWTTTRNVRVLLGNVPTFLMFDDHEVTDDWNFDVAWVRMVHSQRDHYRMWPKTITDALCAYWIYQGLGNKARAQWRGDPRAAALEQAQRAGIDALPELRKCTYRAVMAASPPDADTPFQTGLSLDWHYQLPFEPPFLVPDCRSRRCMVPKDDGLRVIDHRRNPPQSETIDVRQIQWLRDALDRCKHPIAFIAPSTPLLLQKKLMEFMTEPETAARAWAGEVDVVSGLAVFLGSTKLGIASAELIRLFRREKDLEHMIRDKSWRDLWGLVERMRRNRSPVKTLMLVSGDVHHSYCMTGNLSGDGRPLPELLQITSSGLQTTIRGGADKGVAAWQSSFSSDIGQHHIVPGYLSEPGTRRKELVLYRNAVAVVDASLGADVEVRAIHLAGNDARGVDKFVYQYTSGPEYLKAGEPAITPWRHEALDEPASDVMDAAAIESEESTPDDPELEISSPVMEQFEDEEFQDFDQFAEDDPAGGAVQPVVAPAAPATIGFEFDLNVGLSRDVFTASAADMPPGATFPGPGDKVTDHREDDATGKLIDGFNVKVDGPRLEIATLPIKINDDATFTAVVKNVIKFARELEAERGKVTADGSLSVANVAGHPVRFTHPRTSISKLPLVIAVRGPQTGLKWPSDKGVWSAPQATITILLEHVGELIDAVAKSAGTGLGKALTGGSSQRLGVRSDIVVKAKRRVLADRTAKIGTQLSDKSKVTDADYSLRLAGLLTLMTSYLLTSEIVDSDDYEFFAKAYLPINVKVPFRDLFRDALTARERLVFKELYFNNRANFFALAKDRATTSDEDNELFPDKVRGPDLDRFHLHRLTWGTLLDNTVNDIPLKVTRANAVAKKKHALGDEVLWAPISKIIPFASTKPRVALELRRIGFAAHPVKFWEPLMNTVRTLTKRL